MFENIAAISSGLVNQPIGIVRITGPNSFSIVESIFTGKVGNNKEITFGKIVEGKKVIDEVLVAWFKGRDNFVGQDLIEIYCHGGIVVTSSILQLLISKGARLAEPGEFSKIALLNGKMNLIKAEAIHDLIFSKTKKQAEISIKKFDEGISKLIENLIEKIVYIIGVCEVNIDYPEYDEIENADNDFLMKNLSLIKEEVKKIIKNSEKTKIFFTGFKVAIVGKPNVGKSSILNLLLGEERAIVTEIPGTTRDYVEGEIYINEVSFKLIDTAGLRNAENKIEKLGIKRTFEQIKTSDIILHILDEREENNFDMQISKMSKTKKYIKVYNKKDLLSSDFCKKRICVCAREKNVKEIRKKLAFFSPDPNISFENCLNNSRQIGQMKKALKSLEDAEEGLENGHDVGIIVVDIRDA